MNFEKLVSQLRRDLVASPKKAAALGLMLLVALYFWGPLVWKWMAAGGASRSTNMNTAALILTDDPADPAQTGKSRRGGKFRWERVRQLIGQDPRMLSAAFDPTWTDPFAKSGATIVVETSPIDTPQGAVAAESADIGADAAALGIVLNGVFVGPRNRVATINGEARREGDILEVPDKDNRAVVHKLRVTQIRRQSVALELNGRTFSLELTTPTLAEGDEIGRTSIRRGNPKPGN